MLQCTTMNYFLNLLVNIWLLGALKHSLIVFVQQDSILISIKYNLINLIKLFYTNPKFDFKSCILYYSVTSNNEGKKRKQIIKEQNFCSLAKD